MKKSILFKSLVDILFYLHIIGFLGILIIIPFGVVNINQVNMKVEDWTLLSIIIAVVSLLIYVVFLIGLFYLRKTARFLMSNKYFSERIIKNLKKSGIYFLGAGVLSFLLIILFWIAKLYDGKFKLVYDLDFMIPLFLMIIGLFFIIQSETLLLAKNFKEENELTV